MRRLGSLTRAAGIAWLRRRKVRAMTNRPATIIAMIAAVAGPDVQIRKKTPLFVWNASESVPLGLYGVQTPNNLIVTSQVVAMPPEPLASFPREGRLRAARRSSHQAHPRTPRCAATSAISLSMESTWERHASATITVAHSPCGRAAEHRGRCGLSHDWDEPSSLGSRYFGPNPLSAILGRAGPLWIFEKE
jgi:type IV secretory pathway protease TraF